MSVFRFEAIRSTAVAIGVCAVALLHACGGGGGGGGGGAFVPVGAGPTTTPSVDSNPGTTTTVDITYSLRGVVASGSPVAGAEVSLIDTHGATSSKTTSAADGSYTLEKLTSTGPLLLVALDPSGQSQPLVTVIPTSPAPGSATTANATPLTTAVAALITPDGQVLSLREPAVLESLATPTAVSGATAIVRAALGGLLEAHKVPGDFDPTTTAFSADHTGVDAVLDQVNLIQTSTGPQLVPVADASKALALNSTSTPVGSTPPRMPVPDVSTDFLAFVPPALKKCLAAAVADRPDTPACIDVFGTDFLQSGYTDFRQAFPDFELDTSVGASVAMPKTLIMGVATDGVRTATTLTRYVFTDGTTNRMSVVARELAAERTLSDGTRTRWVLSGNRRKYDATISSSIIHTRYVNPASSRPTNIGGLTPTFAIDAPQNAGVASVFVYGPGISGPSSMRIDGTIIQGLFMLRSIDPGFRTFAIANVPLAAPPTSSALITTSNTNIYRWSWQSLNGDRWIDYVGNTLGYNALVPVTSTNLPPLFARYTFVLYDAAAAEIDRFTVTNNAPAVTAEYGQRQLWSVFDEKMIADVMRFGGAQAGAVGGVDLAWTTDSAAPQVTNAALFSSRAGTAVSGFRNTVGGQSPVRVWAGQNNGGTGPKDGASFVALATGATRTVQLSQRNPGNDVRHTDLLVASY